MNFTDTLFDDTWYWAAWLVWLPIFARSLWLAPWRRLADSEQLNVWLGLIVILILVWTLKAGIKPGLSLHLLGANLFLLAFGPHLAFIGLSMVTLGVTLNGESGYFAFAINALILSGMGVLIANASFRLLSTLLPKHFFVFIFINGFFSSALTIIGVGLSSVIFLVLVDAYTLEYLSSEFLPYVFLLAFSEAWLSGMVLTLFVVYRPNWVVYFDDSRYLSDK